MPTILVCEDDRVMSHLISSRLTGAGAQVQIAYDAMQAIMLALRQPPDAVILDINMPGGSGVQVLRRLKSSTKTSLVPVIVVSSSIDPAQQQETMALGAAKFFTKPPNIEALLAYLQETQVLALRS